MEGVQKGLVYVPQGFPSSICCQQCLDVALLKEGFSKIDPPGVLQNVNENLAQNPILRAILCKNQTKWEMKNFDPPT